MAEPKSAFSKNQTDVSLIAFDISTLSAFPRISPFDPSNHHHYLKLTSMVGWLNES
jgi:hypothetical protein